MILLKVFWGSEVIITFFPIKWMTNLLFKFLLSVKLFFILPLWICGYYIKFDCKHMVPTSERILDKSSLRTRWFRVWIHSWEEIINRQLSIKSLSMRLACLLSIVTYISTKYFSLFSLKWNPNILCLLCLQKFCTVSSKQFISELALRATGAFASDIWYEIPLGTPVITVLLGFKGTRTLFSFVHYNHK